MMLCMCGFFHMRKVSLLLKELRYCIIITSLFLYSHTYPPYTQQVFWFILEIFFLAHTSYAHTLRYIYYTSLECIYACLLTTIFLLSLDSPNFLLSFLLLPNKSRKEEEYPIYDDAD